MSFTSASFPRRQAQSHPEKGACACCRSVVSATGHLQPSSLSPPRRGPLFRRRDLPLQGPSRTTCDVRAVAGYNDSHRRPPRRLSPPGTAVAAVGSHGTRRNRRSSSRRTENQASATARHPDKWRLVINIVAVAVHVGKETSPIRGQAATGANVCGRQRCQCQQPAEF